MFTKMAHEAFMKLKQVRRRSWGGGLPYIYIKSPRTPQVFLFGLLCNGPSCVVQPENDHNFDTPPHPTAFKNCREVWRFGIRG